MCIVATEPPVARTSSVALWIAPRVPPQPTTRRSPDSGPRTSGVEIVSRMFMTFWLRVWVMCSWLAGS